MLRTSKKKLVDENGTPIRALNLFKFFATVRNLDGIKREEDLIDIPLSGYLLGNQSEANAEAHRQAEQLIPTYPERKITVKVESMELVGPIIQQQMKGLMENNQFQNLVLFVLARDLAEYKAKENLDINIDKDALAQSLVIEAYELARQKLNKFKAEQEASKQLASSSGLVTATGAPLTTDNASEGAKAPLECPGTGEACCGKDDCSDACAEPADESAEGEDTALDEPVAQLSDEEHPVQRIDRSNVLTGGRGGRIDRDIEPAALGDGTPVEDCEYRTGEDTEGRKLVFAGNLIEFPVNREIVPLSAEL